MEQMGIYKTEEQIPWVFISFYKIFQKQNE